MYIDVNGKHGYRAMQGTSGVVYGNLKLLTPDERAAALADGIRVEAPAPVPAPNPAQLERQRKRQIRGLTADRIRFTVQGTGDEGDDVLTDTLVDLIEVQVDLFRDLKTKGLMVNADFNQRVIDIKDKLVLLRQAKQAMRDAIANGVTAEEFSAALDLIIAPPVDQV